MSDRRKGFGSRNRNPQSKDVNEVEMAQTGDSRKFIGSQKAPEGPDSSNGFAQPKGV